ALGASAVALRVATDRLQQEHSTRETLRRRLREALVARVPDVAVHGPLADAHPGIVAFSALYVDGATLQIELDRAGFAVHSGSSCASAAGAPSHVLVAMKALTHGHVRVSFGPETGVADIDAFVRAYAAIVERLRARHR
ncbi:MAG: aminotransferase class V-fold PLP-dependent enzyme, partial [Nitriliruptoraceae bacterium]